MASVEHFDEDEALARRLQEEYSNISAHENPNWESYNDDGRTTGDGMDGTELASMSDAELAVTLSDAQLAEMMQQQELVQSSEVIERDEEYVELRDPVWGTLRLSEGQTPTRFQVCCFSVCPCCSGEVCVKRTNHNSGLGCLYWECAPSKVDILISLIRTWSFWLALFQVFMLFICIALGNGIAPSKINPMVGPYPTLLNTLGAKNAALIVYKHDWWRLVTPIFLHTGVIHLFVNVAIQVRVGVMLEFQWGPTKFALIYFISGVTSSLLSCIALPNTLSVGSSGALMGLLGGWLVELCCKWPEVSDEEKNETKAYLGVVIFNIVVTLCFSFVPYIDWAAHVGGLIGGIFVGFIVFGSKLQNRNLRISIQILGSVAIAVFISWCWVDVAEYLHPDRDLLHVCRLFRDQFQNEKIPCRASIFKQ